MTKLNVILIVADTLIILSALMYILYKNFSERLSLVKQRLDDSEEECMQKYKVKYESIIKLIDMSLSKYKVESKVFDLAKKIDENEIHNYKDEKLLNKCIKEIIQIKDDNPKIKETKAFKELIESCNKNEISLVSLRSYHNKYTVIYNEMIKKFPYNLISKIKRYNLNSLIDGKELEANFNNDVEV